METFERVRELRASLAVARAGGAEVGFVPTMGALHEGHAALIRRAKRDCRHVVVSIFVNPTQFGPNEDLAAYPRDIHRDREMASQAGAEALFVPSAAEMYPPGFETEVDVPLLAAPLEGSHRPGHFRGVATVVAKLLNIVSADRAYFGEKDFQQLLVVRRMTADLNLPTQIVSVPTVRAADGLALSSRNAYLSSDERASATILYRAILRAEQYVAGGGTDTAGLHAELTRLISSEQSAAVDYIALVDPENLGPVESLAGRLTRLVLAVRIGRTRLIDNALLVAPDAPARNGGGPDTSGA